MGTEQNMKNIVESSFKQYAGAVIQSRSIVDVRDCVKPSARQIFYCLETDKFLHSKPFKKTLKAIGSVARLYIHGDSSAEGVLMRSSQEFAMRYPLIEVEGNNGNLMESGNWAAPRYTASRLSPLCENLFEDIKKDTISEWRDNYDDTEQYPGVLPSKGVYNIINGSSGIAVGLSSSIPQFNIKDVNKAMETLLLNPECSFEEIYCPPDFATGAYLINEEEVKTTLKYGSKKNAKANEEDGASCKLRAKIEYNDKEHCLVVKEIPYGVYTNTICGQLESILEDDETNPGIDRFNDLTGVEPNIKIYLKKGIDPYRVERFLYKNTSLQYHYAINMTMLDQGRFPKVFTWKEALQAHIDHEKIVYRNGFEFDLKKIENKIHIIDGLLICLASIDEVVKTIKSAESTAAAALSLQNKFLLDEQQADAVLNMKLSRLAHLEVEKLKKERADLNEEANRIKKILSDTNLFNQEIINGWRESAKKYGDEHRTKIIKVAEDTKEDKEIELVKPENVVVITTQSGLIKKIPESAFKTQKRNGKGVKSEDDIILSSIKTNTIDTMLFFTNNGRMYRTLVDNIPTGAISTKGTPIQSLIKMENGEKIMAVSSLHRKSMPKYIIFITKNGLIKKSLLEDYNKSGRSGGIKALKIDENDQLVTVLFQDDEEIMMFTKNGMSIRFDTVDITPVGRQARGVAGMKLKDGDTVIAALSIHKYTDMVAIICENGCGKRVDLSEFGKQGRNGKGTICSNDTIVGVTMVDNNDRVFIVGKPNSVCLSAEELPITNKRSGGNILIKGSKIQKISKV